MGFSPPNLEVTHYTSTHMLLASHIVPPNFKGAGRCSRGSGVLGERLCHTSMGTYEATRDVSFCLPPEAFPQIPTWLTSSPPSGLLDESSLGHPIRNGSPSPFLSFTVLSFILFSTLPSHPSFLTYRSICLSPPCCQLLEAIGLCRFA